MELITASALTYAAIPVILSEMDTDFVTRFPAILIGLKLIIAFPALLWPSLRSKVTRLVKDLSVLFFASSQAFFFVLSLVLFTQACSYVTVPVAIVIAETWPILTALLLGYVMRGQVSHLTIKELGWGGVALLGIVLVLDIPGNLHELGSGITKGGFLALGSALSMGASTALKSRAVVILKSQYQIGPLQSFFVLQLYFLSILPIFLIWMYFTQQADLNALNPLLNSFTDMFILIVLIVLLNTLSSVLYSMAALRISKASDGFIWFFTPAFSLVIFAIYSGEAIMGYELIGLAFIISSNLFITITANITAAFKSLILSLLFIGTWCYFVDPIFDQKGAFEALAILSIFYVVLLTSGIDEVSGQRREDQQNVIDFVRQIYNAGSMTHKMFDSYECAKHPVLQKRRYRLLHRHLEKERLLEALATLDKLSLSRTRSLNLGRFTSLFFCLASSFLIGILARPEGWVSQIFITTYLSSMVFSFFHLIESQLSSSKSIYQKTKGPTQSGYLMRIKSKSIKIEDVIWNIILSIFVLSALSLAFSLP